MGRKIEISSKDIRRIIKDTVNEKIATLPNTVLNEVLTMDRINLNEMLLTTVPAKKVVSYLISGFNFATYDDFDNEKNYGIVVQVKENIIQLWIRPNDEEEVKKIMGKLGWICGGRDIYKFRATKVGCYADDIGLFGLQFERKFDEDATDDVFERDFIYHYAPSEALGKIQKQGLVPKTNTWKLFGGEGDTDKNIRYKNVNDDISHNRIFFFLDEPKIDKEDYFKTKSNGKTTETTLLMIDTGKIPFDIKFYKDPKQIGAVYTYENIPPKAIKIVG